MNIKRLQELLKFLEKEPNDPFLLYAIATEYGEENPEKATSYYDTLLNEHPDYSATYYHAAALFAEMGEIDKAKAIYEKGIIICEQQRETKALSELKNAYQNFLFEYDD